MKLSGKIALVTGATGGLGERIAEGLHKEGASLILHGRDQKALEALHAKLPSSQLFCRDMLAPDFLPALGKTLSGGVDIVVNNAGIQGPVGKAWELDLSQWAQTLDVDLLVPVAICQLAVPIIIGRGGGKIINISGGGATNSRPGYSAYAVAKTGLVRFTEILADETRPHKIDVNAIAPGVMPTRMTSLPPQEGKDPFAEPVALAIYLASAESNGISGRLISAVWDDWRTLHTRGELKELYTLRRVVPEAK